MRFRFIKLLTLICVLAGAFAGVAQALDFDDEAPDPVNTEIGRVVDYTIGTHAGCLPHHLVILSGGLPPGTTLTQVNDHTGVIEGIPTEEGTYNVWMAVRDCENRSAEQMYTFNVGRRTYAIQTDSLPAATLNAPYSAKLKAGDHPIRSEEWIVSKGTLPAGLTLAKDGTLSGTPTTSGASTFTVRATSIGDDDGIRVDEKEFTLTVTGQLTVSLTRRVAEAGVRFSSSVGVSGGSGYTFSAPAGLPAGLTITSAGAITGTPAKAGSYNVTIRLTSGSGSNTDVSVRLVVRPRLAIATRVLRSATAGHAYRAAVAIRGGVAGFRWTILRGKLPAGLKLAARTGAISGSPSAAGTFRVTLRVRDALGATATKTLRISVH
jgi:hypothetical protein